MKSFIFLFASCALFCGALAQIKTRQPPPTGNLEQYNNNYNQQEYNSYNQHQNTDIYNGSFKPAEYYQGEPMPNPRPAQILDPTAEFINKTRAGMASGVCFTEVPTSTLVKSGEVAVSNGTAPGMSKIQICCDGYQRNVHVFKRCDPICADDCPNGICTAPNTCVCVPGHVRNSLGKCVTTCPIGCDNGMCTDHGVCQCKTGYTLDTRTGASCEPVCSLGCDKGFCTAPDTCSCPQGSMIDRSGTKCIARCDVPCVNGVCAGPNNCTCDPGFIPSGHPHMCVPYCPQGCPNGFCSAPNFCSCNPGFIKTGIKGRSTCNPEH